MLVCSGIWEPNVTAAFRTLLSHGAVVVDAGANIGYFTLLASHLVGPTGKVYALEPSPTTFAALSENLRLNRAENVVALEVAAGSEAGIGALRIAPTGNSGQASIAPPTDARSCSAIEVAVEPLSQVVAPEDFSRLSLIKVDVEGYEEHVLRGLEPILEAGARPTIVIEVHVASSPNMKTYLDDMCARFGFLPQQLADLGGDRVTAAARSLQSMLTSLRSDEFRVGENLTVVLVPCAEA